MTREVRSASSSDDQRAPLDGAERRWRARVGAIGGRSLCI